MLELLIVILLVLWLTGAVGWRGRRWGRSVGGGNLVHILLVLAIILLLFRVLR